MSLSSNSERYRVKSRISRTAKIRGETDTLRLGVSGGRCYVTSFAAFQRGEPWAMYILASKPLR